MQILKWKKEKKNLYTAFLNNHSEISIYEELVLKYDLLLKKNISDKELEKIKKKLNSREIN